MEVNMVTAEQIRKTANSMGHYPNRWECEEIKTLYRYMPTKGKVDLPKLKAIIGQYYRVSR
jgi:hypothetical protein